MDRYKIMSGLMALVAVFLVFIASKNLKVDMPNLGGQQSNLSFAPDDDWDNDGLSNRDESYWNTDPNKSDTDGDGYLDGKEVTSGHDPLIPAPNDLIDPSNLTEKLSQLTLAGIYEGSLKPGNSDYDASLDKLAIAIAEDALSGFKIDLAKIDLRAAGSDKSSQQAYIEEFSKAYEQLLLTFVNQMTGLEENIIDIGFRGFADKNIIKNFEKSSADYKEIFEDLHKIGVPSGWKTNHLDAMKIAGELSYASHAVVLGKNDPIKATVGLNKIVQLWETLPGITEAYSKKIKSSGLNPGNTIFE